MKIFKISQSTLVLLSLFAATSFSSQANQHQHHHMPDENGEMNIPASKTPISVMGDHLHHEGGWMASYRYMTMEMKGLQTGTSSTSATGALQNYAMVPEEMTMNMHMLGLMYAPTSNLTLMVMANFVDQEMTSLMPSMPMEGEMGMNSEMDMGTSMNSGMGMTEMPMMTHAMEMESDGLADISISALINGFNGDNYRSHFTLGVRLPTGDIDQTRNNMMGEETLMGYPMQLGTDTTNILAGYTYVYDVDKWQLGTQINYETAIEENDADYKPGDKIQWHNWVGYGVNQSLSLSMRLSYLDKGNYSGHDQRLNSMMMPTADPKQRGVSQIDWAIGANYGFIDGMLKNQQISFEYSQPIEQDFEGTQLKTDWQATLGWQLSF
ncbi:transporter [Thalassotalea psychrophila]|uniref:Transporter n=1 Tax=Thalassotalea psychrophila TaxID=3065647 RepID=A0ABY9TTA9_9GAMM|nr:transporter [Colwelliaceae bacterium SQ149]